MQASKGKNPHNFAGAMHPRNINARDRPKIDLTKTKIPAISQLLSF
jgi:hypothetical protein